MKLLVVKLVILCALLSASFGNKFCEWFLPINTADRQSWEGVKLTAIGEFGLERQARPQVPAHLHSGVDFLRPDDNYRDEPVFPAAAGKIISLRSDGPYAQVIIEHVCTAETVWTVYEHLTEIKVAVGEQVGPFQAIGRFMNRDELDRFGWQFDHLHFEILRAKPRPLKPLSKTPYRFCAPYSLECYTPKQLHFFYYSPQEFLQSHWNLAN